MGQNFSAATVNLRPIRRQRKGLRRAFSTMETLESRSLLSASVLNTFGGSGMNGWIPPDTMGAVGPNQVVDFINDQVVIRDKGTGNPLVTESGDTFWANAGVSNVAAYDSRISYDPVSQHWIASSDIDQGKANSRLIVGISNTSDPTQGWRAFTFASNSSSDWADYPTLGVDANGVYMTSNLFTTSGSYAGSRVYAMSKSGLLNFSAGAAAPTVQAFSVNPGGTLLATNDFNANKSATAAEVIADRAGSGLEVRSVTWNNGSASLSGAWSVAVPGVNGTPVNGVQPGSGSEVLDAGDGRLNNATITNGSSSLWTLLPTTINTHAAAVWVQVNLGTRSLAQSGQLADANADILYASIAANDNGDAVIGYTKVSSSQYASVYVNERLGSDAAGTLQGEVLVKAGSATYTDGGKAGAVARWGDYSVTLVDPSDASKFWTYQEYAPSASSYQFGTYWGEVSLGTSVASAPAAPSNLAASAASSSQITLTWTDNSTNESGFKVFRSTDGVNFAQLASQAPAGATSYSDTGLASGQQYWYYVVATNSVGDSSPSNTASATTTATTSATVPAAPSNLVATAAKRSISLSWTDNSTNESGFYVERSTDGANWSQIATLAAGSTSYTNNGAKHGATYYYRVRAYNAAGTSDYSNVATVTAAGHPIAYRPEADWPLNIASIDTSLETHGQHHGLLRHRAWHIGNA